MSIPNAREVAEILRLLEELEDFGRCLGGCVEDDFDNLIQQIKEYLGA